MTAYLMFHLHGPMQSWGSVAVGQVRGNEGYPSRSGVLGLAAAAMGIERNDDRAHEELHNKLGFGVRVCNPGKLLRDYHTAQVPSTRRDSRWRSRSDELNEPKVNTVLSTRDYISDALFAVALWAREPYDLEAMGRAFRSPVFPLYLGRKSCPPGLPIKPRMVEAGDLAAAFTAFRLPRAMEQLFEEAGLDSSGRDIYFDPCSLSDQARHQGNRYDRVLSRSRWTFVARTEYKTSLPEEPT